MHTSSTAARFEPRKQPVSLLDSLLEAAGDIVFRLTVGGQVRAASRRALTLTGVEIGGRALASLAHDVDQPALRNAIAGAGASGAPALVEARFRCQERDIWFELRIATIASGDDAPLLVIGRDMSAQHATEERLRHMATHDSLTELPNRVLLSDRIRMVIANARRSGQGFAVATIGLDGFKKVNDGLGHAIGDAVLRMAEAIVDFLEAVQADGGDRETLAGAARIGDH
ncbi:MAG: GGDEF domain-containing protein, partial [Lysobacteraceae bacterium]